MTKDESSEYMTEYVSGAGDKSVDKKKLWYFIIL